MCRTHYCTGAHIFESKYLRSRVTKSIDETYITGIPKVTALWYLLISEVSNKEDTDRSHEDLRVEG